MTTDDRLRTLLEVALDGIPPREREAVLERAAIMEFRREPKPRNCGVERFAGLEKAEMTILEMPIETLGLSRYTYNRLAELQIRIVGELVNKTEVDLIKGRHFGRGCMNNVKERLAAIGLEVKDWRK